MGWVCAVPIARSAPRATARRPGAPGLELAPNCSCISGLQGLAVRIAFGVCEKTTPPEKNTYRNIGI